MAGSKSKEDELRKRIKKVLEAFSVRNIGERVKDCHGSNEYGLDLVILKKDVFGKLRCYGVQLKSGNISCSGKPNNRIKELIGQLVIAYGRKICVDGTDHKLEGFYVITDGNINTYAEEYIKSASVTLRNVYFIDGRSLNEFLSECGPSAEVFRQT